MIVANRPAASALARVTEAGAVAAARAMGHGDGKHADSLAVDAMRTALDQVGLAGRIVIGEGERDEAPMLFIGETVGPETGTPFDIAVDPLEGTNLVAGGLPNAVATMAIAERGGLLNAPDTYMDKLIVGPPAAGRVSLDYSVRENLQIIADVLRRGIADLTVVVLDRPRHESLIEEIRAAGARIKLISDGDLTAAVSVAVAGTADHAVMGIGGAPEGVLAAAALRCLGGEIQARFKPRDEADRKRLATMGVSDAEQRIFRTEDLASGNQLAVAITGVTDGDLLRGVRFFGGGARTHSLVMDLPSSVIRFVDSIQILDRANLGPVRLGPT